jgi:hypothetical protein
MKNACIFRVCLSAFAATFLTVVVPAAAQWTEQDAANLAHLRSLTGKKHHAALTANLSDPQLMQLTHSLLKAGGTTPSTAPQLHRTLAATATAHAAAAPTKQSLLSANAADTSAVFDYVEVQYVTSTDGNYTAQAVVSIANVTNAVDTLQLFSAVTNQPIGLATQVTQWPGTPIITLQATGTVPQGSSGEVVALLSSVASSNGQTNTYFATTTTCPTGAVCAEEQANAVPAAPPTVTDPQPQTGVSHPGVTGVVVCLGRNTAGTGDCTALGCDYGLPNCTTPNAQPPVLLKLTGFVTTITPVAQPFTASNTTGTATIMPASGGACKLELGTGSLLAGLSSSPPFTQVNWSYTPTPSFGSPCWASGQQVFINFSLTLTQQDQKTVDVNVNNTGQTTCPPTGGVTPSSTSFCPVQFVWGCLAAETPVRMANGSSKPVSRVQPGEKVIADASGRILTVSETVIGDEADPMVRLKDRAGHNVLVTQGHPIVTPGGIVLAKTLSAGDTVLSESGPSKLTSVTRERYHGKVYNVILGYLAEGTTLTDSNRTMIAGGFLVGDNEMQRIHGMRFDSKPVNVLAKLPAVWRDDYRRFAARTARAAAVSTSSSAASAEAAASPAESAAPANAPSTTHRRTRKN